MAVMGIGIMRVVVGQGLVLMRMRMRLGGVYARGVVMQVVFVMHMCMRMGSRAVLVLVRMVLGQVQPYTQAHQRAGRKQLPTDGFCKKQNRYQCPGKRRC